MLNRFKDHISPYIDDSAAFMDALGVRKKRAFRLTASRNIRYRAELGGLFSFEPVNGIDNTYFITDDYDKACDSLSFQTGGLYLMNPSSVLPARLLASFMPDDPLILDMSAAPGGKTCALSDILNRRGLIAANEPSRTRLKALNFNLERCGAWNVKTLSYDGRQLSKFYGGTFDGVLLDAPCSHENQIAVNKKVRDQWSPDYVCRMATLQKDLILSAFDCLKEGGVLVYSTCTFSVEENEEVIRHLLKNREAELITFDHPFSRGVSGDSAIDGAVLRVFPHHTPMDGFFTAAVRRKGKLTPKKALNSTIIGEPEKAFIDGYFKEFPTSFSLHTVDGVVYLESSLPLKGNFYRTGMVLGRKIAKSKREVRIEPSSQLMWEFGACLRDPLKVSVEYKIAQDYMKGFDTPATNKYHGETGQIGLVVFYYKDIPVGVCKIVDSVYKNKLDRYFLYGKTITY